MADRAQRAVKQHSQLSSLIAGNIAQAVAALIIVVISLTVCWLGDDIDYMFRIRTAIWNSSGAINTIPDFFSSQFNHYLHVNGRFVAHSLVQLFCGLLGQPLFAVCNGIVWFLFLKLIALISAGEYASRPATGVTVTTVSLLTFITKMMPTTQIGYIWMFTLTLGWLILYRRSGSTSPVRTVLLTLFGIIAGNGQEALSIGVCCLLLADIMKRIALSAGTERELPLRVWMPALGFLLGTAADCLSPSTVNRAGNVADTVSLTDSLLFAAVALRAFYLMLAVWVLRAFGRRSSFNRLVKENLTWLIAIASMLIFNFAIGVRSNRQLFGVELLSLIVMISILPRHRFGTLFLVLLSGATLAIYLCQYCSALKVKQEFRQIEKEYVESERGVVYGTRVRASSNPFTREFKIYEDITGQFDNDVRHSMMKLLIYRHGKGKVLSFRPVRVRPDSVTGRVASGALTDTVMEIAPWHHLVITSIEKPALIVRQQNRLTSKERSDTLRPARPASFVRLQDGTVRNFYEISPDIPFVVTVSVTGVEPSGS